MNRRPLTSVNDYWAIFLRRKWWVLLPLLVLPSIVFLVGLKLPKLYKSETLILVDPQKVPSDYVKPIVSSDVTDRLQTISQEILSRTRLQAIIDQFGLYKDAKQLTQEEIIESMRHDITVDIVSDPRLQTDRGEGVQGIKISYTGQSPVLAQQVTRQIASLFIEENLKVREQQAEGTKQFIESQLEQARTDLMQQEQRIKAFKARYMGSLPEQEQSNLQVLGQMQNMLQGNNDTIVRDEQERTYLQSLLDMMQPGRGATGSPATSGLEVELAARRAELVEAEQKYQPGHPDVIRLKAEVAALQAKQKALRETEPVTESASQPEQIKSQLTAINQEIQQRKQRQADMEAKVRTLQGRLETLPAVEQQFADLNRDYQTSQANYQSLLQKKDSSTMATEMERRAQGEQFRVLDPASLPEKPYKPDLRLLNLMGLAAGLAVGVGLGALQEFRDTSMHSKQDLAFYVAAPLLGWMPMIQTPQSLELAKRRIRNSWVLGSSAAMVVLAGVAVLIYRGTVSLETLRGWF